MRVKYKTDKQGALWPHTVRKGVNTDWYEVRTGKRRQKHEKVVAGCRVR